VHSGQKARVLAGYVAGGWPYGYRAIVNANVDQPGAIGRAATKGTKLEIVDEQAKVVRRIVQLYAEGHSIWDIATRLNEEKVPRDLAVSIGWQGQWMAKRCNQEHFAQREVHGSFCVEPKQSACAPENRHNHPRNQTCPRAH
jgi:hypothetical protein